MYVPRREYCVVYVVRPSILAYNVDRYSKYCGDNVRILKGKRQLL